MMLCMNTSLTMSCVCNAAEKVWSACSCCSSVRGGFGGAPALPLADGPVDGEGSGLAAEGSGVAFSSLMPPLKLLSALQMPAESWIALCTSASDDSHRPANVVARVTVSPPAAGR